MDYSNNKISLLKIRDINIPDFISVFSFPVENNFLIESVKKSGIINPLIVSKNVSDYVVICGSKRIRAAIVTGFDTIPAIVLEDESLSERGLFDIAFEENSSVRRFNIVETAGIVRLLSDRFKVDHKKINYYYLINSEYSRGNRNLDILKSIDKFEVNIKEYLLKWNISFTAAARMTLFSDIDLESLYHYFAPLELHGGKLKQFLELCLEIMIRENMNSSEIFLSSDIQSVINNNQITGGQKQSKLLDILKSRRFPELKNLEQEFKRQTDGLEGIPAGSISPPTNFEGNFLHANFVFKQFEELEKYCDAVKKSENRNKIKALFDLF